MGYNSKLFINNYNGNYILLTLQILTCKLFLTRRCRCFLRVDTYL